MASHKYRIHICTPEGDLDYVSEIERLPTLLYPTVPDTMEAIGPVVADHYERTTHIVVVNVKDLKFHRVVEFKCDGNPHIAIIKQVAEPLQPLN